MKLNLDEESTEFLLDIFSRQEKNLDFFEFLNLYLQYDFSLFSEEEISKFDKVGYLYQDEFANRLSKKISLDEKNEQIRKYLLESVKFVEIKEYKSNPYFDILKKVKIDENDWKLGTKTIPKMHGFIFDDTYSMGYDFKIYAKLGFSFEDYSYPSLSLCDQEWMSLNPNEINTMDTPIQIASGKVLTLGLGLGYFSYMASNKEEVKEVHIVEMDKDLISIFTDKILPLFPHKEKIHIHKADAFNFINDIKDGDYNFIFADLWHDVGDGLGMFIDLFNKFKTFKRTKHMYWIMNSILTYFRMIVVGVIKDEFYNETKEYNEVQKLIKKSLENIELSSCDDITNLLDVGGLFYLIDKK